MDPNPRPSAWAPVALLTPENRFGGPWPACNSDLGQLGSAPSGTESSRPEGEPFCPFSGVFVFLAYPGLVFAPSPRLPLTKLPERVAHTHVTDVRPAPQSVQAVRASSLGRLGVEALGETHCARASLCARKKVCRSETPTRVRGRSRRSVPQPCLQAGTVTFLFTDIEGSTRLLYELGGRYPQVLAEHRRKLRAVFAAHNGFEVDTQGDAFMYAFSTAAEAVAAASAAQQTLGATPVRARMGLHTGEPTLTAEGYVGLDVHRGARIAAAAHGGQTLLSQTTRDLVEAPVRDLGLHRLKGHVPAAAALPARRGTVSAAQDALSRTPASPGHCIPWSRARASRD